MSAHTPGPWEIIKRNGAKPWWSIYEKRAIVRVGNNGTECGFAVTHVQYSNAALEANAHLIVSSPDILEACRMLCGSLAGACAALGMDETSKPREHIRIGLAAIAKAEGRA